MTAPANTSDDPFSIFEDALWHALESYPPLADLVKVGNRIKLTGTKANPYEASSVANDFPELQLWASGANLEPGAVPRSSTSYFYEQQYSIGLATDQLRTNVPRGINLLKWHLIRAVCRAELSLVKPALPFVTWVKPGNFRDQITDVTPNEDDRRVRGWKGVLDVKVQFCWALTELRA